MFLQNRIKISKLAAASLREALKHKELLWDLQNSNFLYRDLATLSANYSHQKDSFGKRVGPIVKALGSFVVPTFNLAIKSFYEEYTKNRKGGERQELEFLCGPSANGLPILPGVSLYLRDEKNHKLQFWTGEFCLQNLQAQEAITGKIIFELACFFHNRKELYTKIREVLRENAGEFRAATTPEFLEDLILLFSAETRPAVTKSFAINFEATEERRVAGKFNRNKNTWVGRMTCYLRTPGTTSRYFSRLDTEIWLDQKNILSFNTYEGNCTDPSVEIESYSGVKEFIKEKANDMFEQLVTIVNFQAAIYEQVKTKIFLENL